MLTFSFYILYIFIKSIIMSAFYFFKTTYTQYINPHNESMQIQYFHLQLLFMNNACVFHSV